MSPQTGRGRRQRVADALATATIRAFQAVAYAEGGLLPAILVIGVVDWVTGRGGAAVAIVGATHGTAFTAYVLLVPAVARLLHWSLRTTSIALSVAFVPFAPWAFERRIRGQLDARIRRSAVDAAAETGTTAAFDPDRQW
jgi:integral membrane protein